MSRLQGQTAIITGAASGIGRGMAEIFASQGARVVIADIDLARAEEAATELRKVGGDVSAASLDQGSEESIKALIADVSASHGRIDCLVNNAAATFLSATADGPLLNLTTELWDTLMAVNLRGPMLLCRETIPHMVAQGGGSIVNICSNSMFAGDLGQTAYACSKAGLATLTRYIAAQHGAEGVRCNAISPGYIPVKPITDERRAKLDQAVRRQNITSRGGLPADIAWMAVYLASSESGFVNGQVYQVDGGAQAHAAHMPDLKDLLSGV